jgi:hypothetical protein
MAGRDADLLGVSPQPLERIVLTDVLQEDVHHHVAEVHQNPFRGRCAFDAERPLALSRQEAIDVGGDRSSLALRVAGTEYEIVCD